jgi:heme A synthase
MLASLIASFASGETMVAVRRARRALIAYTLAGLAALVGIGFLIGGAYIWTAHHYGWTRAAVGFGVGFLLLAGLVLLINKLMSGAQKRRESRRRNKDLTALAAASALAVLPNLFRGKAGLGTILGPALAVVAYEIYRENRKSRRPAREPDGTPDQD